MDFAVRHNTIVLFVVCGEIVNFVKYKSVCVDKKLGQSLGVYTLHFRICVKLHNVYIIFLLRLPIDILRIVSFSVFSIYRT